MIEFYKKRGETPLEALNRLREENPELKNETLSYAGRLDPMAEGILPVLVGQVENQERAFFLQKDKEYKVEFLLGVSTDTGDVLGIVVNSNAMEVSDSDIQSVCKNFIEIKEQTYPWFSSKTVNGVPLFVYAQKKDFSVERPIRDIKISEVKDIEFRIIETSKVVRGIQTDISKVSGDFRQEESILSWSNAPQQMNKVSKVVSCTISVSSGTYIRSLTEHFLKDTGVPATVLRLERTRVY